MPAKSKAQQKLMALALAYRQGKIKKVSKDVKNAAESMTIEELERFAKTKTKKLPNKMRNENIKTFESFLAEEELDNVEQDDMAYEPEEDSEMDVDMDLGDEESDDSDIQEIPFSDHNPQDVASSESELIQIQLKTIIDKAQEIITMLNSYDPEDWINSKITLADDYISEVRDRIKYSA